MARYPQAPVPASRAFNDGGWPQAVNAILGMKNIETRNKVVDKRLEKLSRAPDMGGTS